MLVENLDAYFRHGVPVQFAGAPAGLQGYLDVADEVLLAKDGVGGVIGTVQYALMPYQSALGADDALTVGGTDYTVLKNVRLDDGKIARVYLQDA